MSYLPPLPEGPSFTLSGDFPVEAGLQDVLALYIGSTNERIVPLRILPPHVTAPERVEMARMMRLPDRVAYGYVRANGGAPVPYFWFCRREGARGPNHGQSLLWDDMIQRACRALNVSDVSRSPFAISDDAARKSPYVASSAAVLHDRALRRAVIIPARDVDRLLPHGVKWAPLETAAATRG